MRMLAGNLTRHKFLGLIMNSHRLNIVDLLNVCELLPKMLGSRRVIIVHAKQNVVCEE